MVDFQVEKMVNVGDPQLGKAEAKCLELKRHKVIGSLSLFCCGWEGFYPGWLGYLGDEKLPMLYRDYNKPLLNRSLLTC